MRDDLPTPPVMPLDAGTGSGCPRRPARRNRWLGLALLLTLLAGPLVARQAVRSGWPLPQCTFLRLTGHPCPFCGTTRSLAALGRGDLRSAVRWNPLGMVAVVALAGWGLVRLLGVRRSWRLGPRSAWAGILLLVLLNWLWLLVRFPIGGG